MHSRFRQGLFSLTPLALACIMLVTIGATKGDWAVFALQGHSMEPTVSQGSLLVVRQVPVEQLTVDNIIIFRAGWIPPEADVAVAHRITRIDQTDGGVLVHTRGDGNAVPDPLPITLEGNVLRIVVAIPHGQALLRYSQLAGLSLVAASVYIAFGRLAFRPTAFPHSRALSAFGAGR